MENLYYKTITKELRTWERQIIAPPSLRNRLSKGVQGKIQNLVPQKVQDLITAAIKTMIETVISGSSLLTKEKQALEPQLSESDFLVERAFAVYYKMAVAQGVGFGLGGFLVNLGDLPALMSIKVKFLFDCCKLYGFNPDEKTERLFMLHVFQLAYCGDARRLELFPIIKNWDANAQQIELDWEKLQIEYRDYMDIAKLLQILPVVGAAAGGAANHSLMKKLKITAMNCYRLRILKP
ncbi:MAG: EcsC family protein [Defluviitaleaceae bacterium]|nr:EcsC family protein [Defluviitaleaceae bacterium]